MEVKKKVPPNDGSKRVWFWAPGCKYEVVLDHARKFDWKLVRDEKYEAKVNVYWIDVASIHDRFKTIQPWQVINHFPGMKEYSFYPRTWVLPGELAEFRQQFDENGKSSGGRVYIIKPDTGCQGRGIFLTDTFKNVPFQENVVAQTYIKKPLLLDGFKFDLRIYCVITSVKPLRMYLFRDGLVRMCTEPYTKPTKENLTNSCMHLTNYAVNKRNANFQQPTEESYEAHQDDGSKRSLHWFIEYVTEHYSAKKAEYLLNRIGTMCVRTILSVMPTLSREYDFYFKAFSRIPTNPVSDTSTDRGGEAPGDTDGNTSAASPGRKASSFFPGNQEAETDSEELKGSEQDDEAVDQANYLVNETVGTSSTETKAGNSIPYRGSRCFEVLGFDIMIDAALKPWLIEVNHLPSFGTDSPLDLDVKGRLVKQVLEAVAVLPDDEAAYIKHHRQEAARRLAARRTDRGHDAGKSGSTASPVRRKSIRRPPPGGWENGSVAGSSNTTTTGVFNGFSEQEQPETKSPVDSTAGDEGVKNQTSVLVECHGESNGSESQVDEPGTPEASGHVEETTWPGYSESSEEVAALPLENKIVSAGDRLANEGQLLKVKEFESFKNSSSTTTMKGLQQSQVVAQNDAFAVLGQIASKTSAVQSESGENQQQASQPTSPRVASPDRVEEIRRELWDIYEICCPDKISKIDKLLAKYAGREEEFLEFVHEKYGIPTIVVEPLSSIPTAIPVADATSVLTGGDEVQGDGSSLGYLPELGLSGSKEPLPCRRPRRATPVADSSKALTLRPPFRGGGGPSNIDDSSRYRQSRSLSPGGRRMNDGDDDDVEAAEYRKSVIAEHIGSGATDPWMSVEATCMPEFICIFPSPSSSSSFLSTQLPGTATLDSALAGSRSGGLNVVASSSSQQASKNSCLEKDLGSKADRDELDEAEYEEETDDDEDEGLGGGDQGNSARWTEDSSLGESSSVAGESVKKKKRYKGKVASYKEILCQVFEIDRRITMRFHKPLRSRSSSSAPSDVSQRSHRGTSKSLKPSAEHNAELARKQADAAKRLMHGRSTSNTVQTLGTAALQQEISTFARALLEQGCGPSSTSGILPVDPTGQDLLGHTVADIFPNASFSESATHKMYLERLLAHPLGAALGPFANKSDSQALLAQASGPSVGQSRSRVLTSTGVYLLDPHVPDKSTRGMQPVAPLNGQPQTMLTRQATYVSPSDVSPVLLHQSFDGGRGPSGMQPASGTFARDRGSFPQLSITGVYPGTLSSTVVKQQVFQFDASGNYNGNSNTGHVVQSPASGNSSRVTFSHLGGGAKQATSNSPSMPRMFQPKQGMGGNAANAAASEAVKEMNSTSGKRGKTVYSQSPHVGDRKA